MTLRSALELLKTMPGQYAETEVEVDPRAELSGVYPLHRRGRYGHAPHKGRTCHGI